MKLTIIKPHCTNPPKTKRLNEVFHLAFEQAKKQTNTSDLSLEWIETAAELSRYLEQKDQLRNRKILFVISLGDSGINLELYSIIKLIRLNLHCFDGSEAGLILDGNSDLYTKSMAREFAMTVNLSGCLLIGRPLVEGTKALKNFIITASNLDTDLLGAYISSMRDLIVRLLQFKRVSFSRPNILCLHASSYQTSNTLNLWGMVKHHLTDCCDIHEISLRNGEILDCAGCSYNMCMHYSQKSSCYYGGTIVEEVYPAIEACDALVMLCPNYNDAIGANLTAFINRLTALFRKRQFYDKYLFAVIVSGYSGSDIVAQQLIDSLNMNKTFLLPGHFALMETANNPGSIREVDGIEETARGFAENMKRYLLS
jgi:multimeric flavodoxin WrbA